MSTVEIVNFFIDSQNLQIVPPSNRHSLWRNFWNDDAALTIGAAVWKVHHFTAKQFPAVIREKFFVRDFVGIRDRQWHRIREDNPVRYFFFRDRYNTPWIGGEFRQRLCQNFHPECLANSFCRIRLRDALNPNLWRCKQPLVGLCRRDFSRRESSVSRNWNCIAGLRLPSTYSWAWGICRLIWQWIFRQLPFLRSARKFFQILVGRCVDVFCRQFHARLSLIFFRTYLWALSFCRLEVCRWKGNHCWRDLDDLFHDFRLVVRIWCLLVRRLPHYISLDKRIFIHESSPSDNIFLIFKERCSAEA